MAKYGLSADDVQQIKDVCEFPHILNVKDANCAICHEPLENSGPAEPMELACGHVFGKSCLMEWIAQEGTQDPKNAQCPTCRCEVLPQTVKRVQKRAKTHRSSACTEDAKYYFDTIFRQVKNYNPIKVQMLYYGMTKDAKTWMDIAEKLWDDLCITIYDELQMGDEDYAEHSYDDLHGKLECFECLLRPVAERILVFAHPSNLYIARKMGLWDSLGSLDPVQQAALDRLFKHFDEDAPEFTYIKSWRVYSAFGDQELSIVKYRQWVQNARERLIDRIERAKLMLLRGEEAQLRKIRV